MAIKWVVGINKEFYPSVYFFEQGEYDLATEKFEQLTRDNKEVDDDDEIEVFIASVGVIRIIK